MVSFYKTDDLYGTITNLIIKARDNFLNVSVCFEKNIEALEYSAWLWNRYKTVAHGVSGDPFQNSQPVWIDSEPDLKKEVIITVNNANFMQNDWKKMLFVTQDKIYHDFANAYYWLNLGESWKKISKEEFL